MVQMLEKEVYLSVRKQDEGIMKFIITDCENEYSKTMKDATGRDYNCSVKIDPQYLTSEQ